MSKWSALSEPLAVVGTLATNRVPFCATVTSSAPGEEMIVALT
jgi:hypothetical protein